MYISRCDMIFSPTKHGIEILNEGKGMVWGAEGLLDNESEINHHLNKYCSKHFLFIHILGIEIFISKTKEIRENGIPQRSTFTFLLFRALPSS